jgi:hypothetical protein
LSYRRHYSTPGRILFFKPYLSAKMAVPTDGRIQQDRAFHLKGLSGSLLS